MPSAMEGHLDMADLVAISDAMRTARYRAYLAQAAMPILGEYLKNITNAIKSETKYGKKVGLSLKSPTIGKYIPFDQIRPLSLEMAGSELHRREMQKTESTLKSRLILKNIEDELRIALDWSFYYFCSALALFAQEAQERKHLLKMSPVGIDDEREIVRASRLFAKTIRSNIPDFPRDEVDDAGLIWSILADGLFKIDAPEVPRRNDGIEFETSCVRVLTGAGFDARRTRRSSDYGADIIATKDGLKYAIQCKATQAPAGISAVQEVLGGRDFYHADFAVLVSNAGFTRGARNAASAGAVILCSLRSLPQVEFAARSIKY